jgi:DNA-directed RNA polymerase specialized sigma24 family protein
MSTSQAVTQHLPFLRRYGRALAGSQQSGDAYVAATLEALVADPDVVQQSSSPRAALYRLFTKIWNSVDINGVTEPASQIKMPVEQRLGNITPLPRQAFLLVALEGFSEEDAAAILDVDVATLRQLVERSGRELAAEIATDVLIIEDETLIAMDLEELVEHLGHRVLGVARTHRERAHAGQGQAARADPGRHPARRRQLRPRRGQRAAAIVRSAGDLHHRVSGAVPDRRAARTGVSDRQAVPAGNGFRGDQPGAVLRTQGAASAAARHGVILLCGAARMASMDNR